MSLRSVAVFVTLACPAIAAEPAAKSPLTPEQQRASFRLAPGFRIDLVASEPQVESPVAAAFDERGRLWVVEMRDYPNGPAKGDTPKGRVKVLEDRDGDGRYETATVFADNLLFANGVLPWADGAIVTAAPQILFLHDSDGDGVCDRREVLYEGFVAGNPQLRVSHPALGPDGWITVANGLRGGEVRRRPDGPAIPIGGKDFRFDPVRDRAEAVPGMGQFGNAFDRWGQRFVCDNRNHLRHVVFPTDPAARNPLLPARPLLEDVGGAADGPLSSGTKVYPLSRNWTTSNLHAGRFTAACGVFLDRGGLFPAQFAGAAFTCEPTGNLLHAEILTPHGATFRSRPWKEGTEFLATADEWFRPVSMTQAPDGSLVLVDMGRAVIEHPEFMPPELKNRPDLMLSADRGRLWRIAPEANTPGPMKPALDKLKTPELVARLGHDNGWYRTTAQRLLLTGTDPDAGKLLEAYAQETPSPDGLILAAWLLNAKSGTVPPAVHQRMSKHENPRVREHAVRLLEVGTPTADDFLAFARDADARVRFQAALSLAACPGDDAVSLLAAIAAKDAADPWTRLAITGASANRAGKLVAALAADPAFDDTEPRLALVHDLAELVGSRKDPAEVAALVGVLGGKNAVWQRVGLAGLAGGVTRRGGSFPAYLATLSDAKPITALLAAATAPADDATAAEADRVAAVRLLAHAPWDVSGPVLTRLLSSDATAPALRLAAVRSVAAHNRPEVPSLLLKGWRGYTPALRSEVLDALLNRPDRAAALLDAVEAGTLKPTDIDPARARRLMASKDTAVATLAGKLLRDSLPADRREVLAKYRDALTLPGDAGRGREVFRAACAGCHAVAGVGTAVGPDISDTRTKTPEMLLTDILTPNAAVDGNFVSYTVGTKDGRSFVGFIAAESATAITLKADGNRAETVLRADIEELKSTGLSLMPDGLEKSVTVPQMADLIRFLKDWRYLDGPP